MVDKAVQSPIVTVGVLIHQAGDEVGGDGDDKSLGAEPQAPEDPSGWTPSRWHRSIWLRDGPPPGLPIQRCCSNRILVPELMLLTYLAFPSLTRGRKPLAVKRVNYDHLRKEC